MAQQRYGFFDSAGEDIRSYTSVDMATAFHTLASNGVANLGTCLQVTAEGSTMRTLVGYGSAMIEGYYYTLRDDGSGIQAFAHTTEEELDRIDRIVLQLNYTDRTIALVKVIGTAAATAEAPALTQTEETYALSLAQVHIRAGATEILSTDITDERADDTVCGLIAPESLRRSEIEQLLEDAIDEATGDVLRYGVQTLTEAEQAQAQENVDAQQVITVDGIVKSDAEGNVSKAVAGVDYAIPVQETSTTLLATGWTGTEAPFAQAVSISGIAETTTGISIGLADSATDEEYEAALGALLRPTAQSTDSITITAIGDVPTVDLPILIRIVG